MNARAVLGLAGCAAFVGLAAVMVPFNLQAFAQGAPPPGYGGGGGEPLTGGAHEYMGATVSDPAGPLPDATHIIVKLPNQIKWTGNESLLYGDPTKPGDPYSVLVKLAPGEFSRPHTLASNLWVFVVSGTLWVSDSSSFDPKASYPVKGNNFVTGLANTTFWGGSRAGATEPTVLIISGVGSADNHIMGAYSEKTAVSVSDPAGAAPDVSHITITDVPTTGNPDLYGGGQKSTVEGQPYGVVQTWKAGKYSSPHYHPHPRYIYVLQGPWWVSSSSFHDTKLTYPVPTGSFVEDIPHGIHWDGNRTGETTTTRLYITGVAPATNHPVDEDSVDLPPRPPGSGPNGPRPAGAQ